VKKHLLLCSQAHTENLGLTDLDNHALHDAMDVVFDNIEIGLERVSRLVQNISIANDGDKANVELFDMNACVRAIAHKLSNQFPHNINIELRLTQLPSLYINVYKISQLLINLITNARESIAGGGEICITTSRKGSLVEVSVVDNGCGIEQHLQDIIFDPCYSTKKDAVETGLGLAISRDIAHEHGGSLRVLSIQGEGSVFTLTLPVSEFLVH
jgi:signal transduction histidine kinase